MVEYSKVNVKLSETQLKKLETAVWDKTGTTLRMSFKMFAKDELSHELLLTKRLKTILRNAFNINISTDLKLSRAQISKIIWRISWQITWSITKNSITINKKYVIKPLAKSVLIPLGLTAAASAADAGIHKKY